MERNNDMDDELFSFDAIEQRANQGEENEKDTEEDDSPQAEIWTEKVGPAPMDYLIVVQTTVYPAPELTPVYVLVWSHPESLNYYVSKYPVIKDKKLLPQNERGVPEEDYEQVMDAKESKYFNEIFIIDRILDRKIAELKKYEMDTKYAPHCLRITNAWGQYIDLYAERYLKDSPEQEYLQVHSRNGRYLYTASHESYARLHELGIIYENQLGKPPKENYFVKFLYFKDLPAKYYYYALPLKTLKHMAMEEKLETGQFLPEFIGKKFRSSPILTSVRGGPSATAKGALSEATIDVNPAIRIYAIVMHIDDGSENDFIVLSKRSRFNDCVDGKYHAFDFEWKEMILKAFETRESACNDEEYGGLFAKIYKLNDDIAESEAPYCWRKGMDDPYGFETISFCESVGSEMDKSSSSINYSKKPPNFRIMSEPHPSATIKVNNYEKVPLEP